jgi:hypothetical protein
MYNRFTKALISLVFVVGLIISSGLAVTSSSSEAFAQGRGLHRGWWDRNRDRDRDHWFRIRRLDRDHRIRYHTNGSTRLVGYYDRFGRFHAYGYYDRFGRFHRY